MTAMTQPEGRSMRELRAIVAADQARFDRLAEVWNDLTESEQEGLAVTAETLAAQPVVRDPEAWAEVARAGHSVKA